MMATSVFHIWEQSWEDRTTTNWPKLLYKSYGISVIDWNSREIYWALQAKLLIKVLDYQTSVLRHYLGLDWVRLHKELTVIHLSY